MKKLYIFPYPIYFYRFLQEVTRKFIMVQFYPNKISLWRSIIEKRKLHNV